MCLSIPLPGSGSPCAPGVRWDTLPGRRVRAQHLTSLPASVYLQQRTEPLLLPVLGGGGGENTVLRGSGADLGLFHHLTPPSAYRGAHPPPRPPLLPVSGCPASPGMPPGPRGRVPSRCSQYVTAHICPLPTGRGRLPRPWGWRALGVTLRAAGAPAAARLRRSFRRRREGFGSRVRLRRPTGSSVPPLPASPGSGRQGRAAADAVRVRPPVLPMGWGSFLLFPAMPVPAQQAASPSCPGDAAVLAPGVLWHTDPHRVPSLIRG